MEICQKHLSLHTEHYGFTALVPAFLDMLQGGNIGKTIVNVARRVSEPRLVYRIHYRYTVYAESP